MLTVRAFIYYFRLITCSIFSMIYYFFLLYVAATILPMAKSNNFRHKGRLLNIKVLSDECKLVSAWQ